MDKKQKQYTPQNLPSNEYALKQLAYLNPLDYEELKIVSKSQILYLDIKGFIVQCEQLDQIDEGCIGLSSLFRNMMQISKIEKVPLKIPRIKEKNPLNSIELQIELLLYDDLVQLDSNGFLVIQETDIDQCVKKLYQKKYINKDEQFVIQIQQGKVTLKAEVIKFESLKEDCDTMTFGKFEKQSEIICKVHSKSKGQLKLNTQRIEEKRIFIKNPNFQELGIGGLDREFQEIFRRAFNSRRYPQSIIDKYGIKHVRGMLLYGPPGTGKTLIARQIAKALDCIEPKIVHGPEIFDKYVGGSEKKIRDLFADAERDMKEKGDESQLHIIIFDEIDAICRSRGSVGNSGTGVADTVVNQLLSKIDGVDSLNNILVIGMTNRKDMIDEAMLRPGRLEIHLEIGLPTADGRIQIFQIHTKQAKENNLLSSDVDFKKLATLTKNYTGAEIEAVCRSATSFALFKTTDLTQINTKSKKMVENSVSMDDFMQALEEIKPAFGIDNTELESNLLQGIINYSDRYNNIFKASKDFIEEIKNSTKTQLLSILIEGKNGSGKTALTSKLALESQFPFIKVISAENFVGYSEHAKVQAIVKIFTDAYKSQLSLIILDDFERLIEFIHIGPRFSNLILQTLLVLIKKKPQNSERKLLVLCTTSIKSILQELSVVECFNVSLSLPTVSNKDEFSRVLSNYNCPSQEQQKISDYLALQAGGIPIKTLVLAIDIAIQKSSQGKLEFDLLKQSVSDVFQDNF